MNKRIILSTMLALSTALTMATYATVVRAQNDDVFVDEGDGDFDAVPPMPEASPAKEAKPAAKGKKEEAKPAPPPPNSAIDDAFEDANPVAGDTDDGLIPPPPGEEPAAAAPSAPAPKSKKKAAAAAPAPAPKKASAPKAHAKAGKGKFVVTKAACPAVREPASADQVFMTYPARKIWVEVVDENWVRGFNKAGEAGYISTDCVE